MQKVQTILYCKHYLSCLRMLTCHTTRDTIFPAGGC